MKVAAIRLRAWSAAEDAEARRLRDEGLTAREIGRRLGRTGMAVEDHFRPRPEKRTHRKPPLSLDGKATRTCLKCRQPFRSEGIHNRLCEPCKGTIGKVFGAGPVDCGHRVLRSRP